MDVAEKLKALMDEMEGRIARLKAVERTLSALDVTDFPEEAQAIRILLWDPKKVAEAESRLAELKGRIAQTDKAQILVHA